MYDLGFGLILLGLMLMAVLYSSIGHGGASGYLVVLSLTSFGMMEPVWLKQNVWCLNLVVSSIAFYHYRNSGFHDWGLTIPFVISSVPMVLIGSYMRVDGALYDVLLSFVLLLAAWRLFSTVEHDEQDVYEVPGFRREVLGIGGGIGFASGVIGLGGGIFLSPLIILKKWGSPKATAATASVFVWLNSATGLIGSSVSEGFGVDFSDLAPFAIAVLIGVLWVSLWSRICSAKQSQGVSDCGSRYCLCKESPRRCRALALIRILSCLRDRTLGEDKSQCTCLW